MKQTLTAIVAALITTADGNAETVPESTITTPVSASVQGYTQLLSQGARAYSGLADTYSKDQSSRTYQTQIAELRRGIEFLKTAEEALGPIDNSALYSQLFELEPLDPLEELLEGGPREQPTFEFHTTDISELQAQVETLETYVDDNLLTCATHTTNMRNYNTIAEMVDAYRETLESQGVSLSKYAESIYRPAQKSALEALRSFPADCSSQTDQGAVQEDKVMQVPKPLFDNLYEPKERVPEQYTLTPLVVEVPVEESTPQQVSVRESNKPLMCQFVEQGYIPHNQISDKCSEGNIPRLPEFARIPYSQSIRPGSTHTTYQVFDCETRAKLIVETGTGWIIGNPQFPNKKDLCARE